MLVSTVCLLVVLVSPSLCTSIASITGTSRPGIVIGKRYLLFAPSALESIPLEEYQVSVGSENIDIKAFLPHPYYTQKRSDAKGRTGKDNRDNIALVIVSKDLPIGRDNVEQANLPGNPNFNPEGPAYVLQWDKNQNYSSTNIVINSKSSCETTHPDIDCTRNLWGTASNICDIAAGAPVFSGTTLIGTIATSKWCRMAGAKHLFINSLPHFENWINRTISDEKIYSV